MNLGRDLREFRKQNNWTQKQISEKLGIPSTTWARRFRSPWMRCTGAACRISQA